MPGNRGASAAEREYRSINGTGTVLGFCDRVHRPTLNVFLRSPAPLQLRSRLWPKADQALPTATLESQSPNAVRERINLIHPSASRADCSRRLARTVDHPMDHRRAVGRQHRSCDPQISCAPGPLSIGGYCWASTFKVTDTSPVVAGFDSAAGAAGHAREFHGAEKATGSFRFDSQLTPNERYS